MAFFKTFWTVIGISVLSLVIVLAVPTNNELYVSYIEGEVFLPIDRVPAVTLEEILHVGSETKAIVVKMHEIWDQVRRGSQTAIIESYIQIPVPSAHLNGSQLQLIAVFYEDQMVYRLAGLQTSNVSIFVWNLPSNLTDQTSMEPFTIEILGAENLSIENFERVSFPPFFAPDIAYRSYLFFPLGLLPSFSVEHWNDEWTLHIGLFYDERQYLELGSDKGFKEFIDH